MKKCPKAPWRVLSIILIVILASKKSAIVYCNKAILLKCLDVCNFLV